MRRLFTLLATAAISSAYAGSAQSANAAELQAMEAKLTDLRKVYSDQHPAVMDLLRRIETHKSTPGPESPSAPETKPVSELQAAHERLSVLRRLHGNEHPEVKKQVKRIEQLEQEEAK